MTSFDYFFVQSFILSGVAIIQARASNINLLDVKNEGRFWLAMRCVSGIISAPCFYMAVKYLPSSKATFIKNSYPIFVAVAAYLFMGEDINIYQGITTLTVFSGTIIMNLSKTTSEKLDHTDEEIWFGIILSLIATLAGVAITISIRQMNKHLHFMLNSTYFAFASFSFALILLVAQPDLYHIEHYTIMDIVRFGMAGGVHYVSQIFNSIAFQKAEASIVAPFTYGQGVFLMSVDIFVFHYSFSLTDVTGMFIVVASLYAGYRFSNINKTKKA